MNWILLGSLLFAKILHNATTLAYGDFKGSSKTAYQYLTLATGFGGFVWYGCLIGSFFVMKWYLPLVLFILTIPLGFLTPRDQMKRIYCSFALPPVLAVCVVLLVLLALA
jgi:hypothetical protein